MEGNEKNRYDIFEITNCDSNNAFEQVEFKCCQLGSPKFCKKERIGKKQMSKMLLNHTLKRPINEIDQVKWYNEEASILK